MNGLTLENEKVYLRLLSVSDIPLLYPISSIEDHWQHSITTAFGDQEVLNTYIAEALSQHQNKQSIPFVVIDNLSGEVAGSTRLYKINRPNKSCAIGYTWYAKKFQGTHINKNCKYLLLQYAFEMMEMERVEFEADKDNHRSVNAIRSIGATHEGTLRNNILMHNGKRRNTAILSVLKEEWLSHVKNNLQQKINIL